MALFGKKEEEPVAQMDEKAGSTPVDQVLQLRQQGMSNNQIIQNLQMQGFKSHQIFDAMNQADMKTSGEAQGQMTALPPKDLGQTEQPQRQQQPLVGRQAQMPDSATLPAPATGPAVPPPPPPAQPMGAPMPLGVGNNEERIEEIAESIIEEKWTDLIKNVNKIVEWKDKTEARISRMEDGMKHLKDSFDELHRGVLGKISDYEQSVADVGTDLKALEKVFQKILPTLTENVNELGRITGSMKKKK